MRRVVPVWLSFILVAGVVVADEPAQDELPALELGSEMQKTSYSIGVSIGKNMKQNGVEVDAESLYRGIVDALAGQQQMTDDEIMATMRAFQERAMTAQRDRAKNLGKTNQDAGRAFLAKNKTAKGVVALPSGLQYKILKEGKGPKPKVSDTVVTHYKGTLIDGTTFDSSEGGEPISFPVSGVIAGWTEALQLMPVGSKWQLFIPSELAYGEQGAGPQIGPHATLVFDIELLEIKK